MKISTRWIKVIKDLLNNLARTILVVFSIAVGVFAVGMTTNAGRIIKKDMNDQFLATNPDSATLFISPFHEDLVRAATALREVDQAEGRRVLPVEVERKDGSWDQLILNAVPDYGDVKINQFSIERGAPEPGIREVFLERKTAEFLDLSVGEVIRIRLPGLDRGYALQVAGVVHDIHAIPPEFLMQTNAYVSMDTLRSMNAGGHYNALLFTVSDNSYDKKQNMKVAVDIRDRVVEPSGYQVARIVVEEMGLAAGKHWAFRDIGGFILILNFMGGMCILLTVSLIINTISAILKQQIKQIGMIRLVGGLRHQVFMMYIVKIIILSLGALMIAVPTGVVGAGALVRFAADFININATRVDLPAAIILLQAGIGLIIPLAAAVVPITTGTSISVYEALYIHGSIAAKKRSVIEKILKNIQGLTSPVTLSIRNTFRKKARLILTLLTLSLAGAAFISAPSTHKSILTAFDVIIRYMQYDTSLTIPGGADLFTAEREAQRATHASIVEGWYQDHATFISESGAESEAIEVMAVPHNSRTIDPKIVEGRWLREGDANMMVVNEDLLDQMPHLKVGSQVRVKVNNLERPFRIVGVVSRHVFGARIYIPYQHYTKLTGSHNQTNLIRVRFLEEGFQDQKSQTALAHQLNARYKTLSIGEGVSDTQSDLIENVLGSSLITLILLLLMAFLLALVGGLGLAGTMSMNVMERTREIGVLRAMGASNLAIRKIVLTEGLVVCGLSWLLGILLSYPLGMVLSDAVLLAIMQSKSEFVYSWEGAAIWLGLIMIITIFACLAPAQRASRLTVREVLAYE